MPQYLCLASSFTNVLNVYAFCNLRDVSWGTKESDHVDVPTPSATMPGSQLGGAQCRENGNGVHATHEAMEAMQPKNLNSDGWYEAALKRVLAKDTDTNEHPPP